MKSVTVHNGGRLAVGKILCLGRNYAEHAKEMKSEIPTTPVVFLKPATALIADGEPILLPHISNEVHHEVELVVAIGKEGKSISSANALEHILGYGVGLDMTMRDVQAEAKKKGLPWTVAKGFDTSAPVSEIIPAGEIRNPLDLTIRCSVNGALRQQTHISRMIFPVEAIIQYVSSIFSLERGDLLFTGTPEGVGPVGAGDVIDAELVGYARTSHPVVAD